ncbi:hypothetical protein H0088_004090 [Salmonella enterica]|nr:hypothetical protein [Salmonella enterica]
MNTDLINIIECIKSNLENSKEIKGKLERHTANELCSCLGEASLCRTAKGCFECPVGYSDKEGYSYQIIQVWRQL